MATSAGLRDHANLVELVGFSYVLYRTLLQLLYVRQVKILAQRSLY